MLFLERHRAENLPRDRGLGDGPAPQHVDISADNREGGSQFVSGISHELTHPFLGFAAFVHRLRDTRCRVVVGGGQRTDLVAARRNEAPLREISSGERIERFG